MNPSLVAGPNGFINHVCMDTYEVDDTWEQSNPILPAVSQLHSFDSNPVLYSVDKDWTWFDALRGDTFVFDVVTSFGAEALLELWDSQGNSLNISAAGHLEWVAPQNGKYYLSVSPQSDQAPYGCTDVAGYNLTLSLTPLNRLYLPVIYQVTP
jgi:hypothetical protein